MRRTPKYNNFKHEELPPWQLFKRYQKVTKCEDELFGRMNRKIMLEALKGKKVKL